MVLFNNPLDKVRVAAPCNADWNAMIGDYRTRFCGHCNLHVYNLSSMTKAEAESLIARSEGKLCVRFYRRADGSILTENCPVGLRAIRRRVSSVSKAIATAVLSFFTGLGVYQGLSALSILNPPPRYQTMGTIAASRTLPVLQGKPVVEPMEMGSRAIPPLDTYFKKRPTRRRR